MRKYKPFEIALTQFGIKELPGTTVNNPNILYYFHVIGHKWVQDDETSWCSAFVNYCHKICGYEYSGKLDARSWLGVGEVIKEPEVGDVVIFWREDEKSWKGHVGFYIGEDNKSGDIYVLGGNQSNEVNISPYSKRKLLGYRRPKVKAPQ